MDWIKYDHEKGLPDNKDNLMLYFKEGGLAFMDADNESINSIPEEWSCDADAIGDGGKMFDDYGKQFDTLLYYGILKLPNERD